MSIWGRRDSESPAEETSESQAEAQDTQELAGEHQAGEPAPAFWRAQEQAPASPGRDPADAPPPEYEHMPDNPPPAGVPTTMDPAPAYGQQAPGGAPAPAANEDPAGAPVPMLTGVVIDGENAVKDPGLTETPADQAGTHGAETGAPEAAEVQEPTVAVAREPVMHEAQEPAAAGAEPAMVTEPAATGAEQPAVATITAQRWSEIMASFVDDPRGSVKMAADAVDSAVEELMASVRTQQQALASSWQSGEADTEQLRGALREYRSFGAQLQQMSPPGTARA